MFWIIWCYLGLSFIQFSDTQRRALVNYPYVTAKTPANILPTSSPNNSDVSLNQIPNSSTATLDVQKNDPPLTPEKQKDLVHDGGLTGLPKSGHAATATEELKKNSNSRGVDIKHDSIEVRTVSPVLKDEHSSRDNKKNGTSSTHISPTQPQMHETSTKNHNIHVERTEFARDERIASKSHSEETSGPIEFSNKREEKDSSYIDPVFIRENSRIPNKEESVADYDSRSKSEPSAARNKDVSRSNEERRFHPDSAFAPRDDHRVRGEDRGRDRLPSERRYIDSGPDRRRYDDTYSDSDRKGYRDEKFDDMSGREISRRDRVLEEQYVNQRKRSNGQVDSSSREDRYRDQNKGERYSGERRRYNGDSYDERYRDRVSIDGKYDEPYRDKAPVDDRYEERYRDRVPVEDRYDERYRDRIPLRDKYDERYRVPVDDKYDVRYRDRVPVGDKYDERYRDRVSADDKYSERYPDERRRRGDTDYQDRPIREDRYRDRAAPDDRYLESDKRKSSDEKYEYRPQVDERYKDEVRKTDEDSKYESRAHDGKMLSRDEYDYRDEARIKSSEERFLDKRYDTRDDVYRYRDRFDEERTRSERDRNPDHSIQGSRSRDSNGDRYDNKETRAYRGRTPLIHDSPDYSYSSREEDKMNTDLPLTRERDLLSSRAQYETLPAKTIPEQREYRTRNDRKDSVYDKSDIEQSGSYSKDYNTEVRRDGTSESRYRNGYRNQEYQGRSQYDNRDRITPTRVRDSQLFSRDKTDEEDEFRTKSFNDDRREETSLRDNRSSIIRSTNHQNTDDRTRMTTRIDDSVDKGITRNRERKSEGSRDFDNTRSEHSLKPNDAKHAEVVLDHRSYSSEDGYNDRNRKFESPVDSRDRVNRPINAERRDYRYEESPSTNKDYAYEHRPSRRTEYEASDYSSRGSNSRNRDIRNDKERDRNVRDQDYIRDRFNGDRDVYRDSRLDTEETPKQNRRRVDEERYDERYESRSYDRYPSSDDRIRNNNATRALNRDPAWDETSQSRNRRYRPENDRDAPPPRDISVNVKDETRYSDDKPPMESTRDRSPSGRDNEFQKRIVQPSNSNAQLTSRVELSRGVSHLVSSNYDPEQPLSAKDVIDAALRHSEIPGQTAKKVFYPVFDPRVSNLTSPETIRPSERRGITVTAKKRRKRWLNN